MRKEYILLIRKAHQDQFTSNLESYLLRKDIETERIKITSTQKSIKLIIEYDVSFEQKIKDLELIISPFLDNNDLEKFIEDLKVEDNKNYKTSNVFNNLK
jgi:hypothetical protein